MGFGPAQMRDPRRASCPLRSRWSRVPQPIRSGLALDTLDPSEGSVNLTVRPTRNYSDPASVYGEPGEAAETMSGCANLLVSVIDPKRHKPVKGASVTVSVSPVRFVKGAGHEFLCTASDPTKLRCGAAICPASTLRPRPAAPHLLGSERGPSRKDDPYGERGSPCLPQGGTDHHADHPVCGTSIYDKLGTISVLEVKNLIEHAQQLTSTNHFQESLRRSPRRRLRAARDRPADSGGNIRHHRGGFDDTTLPRHRNRPRRHRTGAQQEKLIDLFSFRRSTYPGTVSNAHHEPRANVRVVGAFSDDILHGLWVHLFTPRGGSGVCEPPRTSPTFHPARDTRSSAPTSIFTRSPTAIRPKPPDRGLGYPTADGSTPSSPASSSRPTTCPRTFSDRFCINQYDPLAFVERQPYLIRESQPDLKGRFS